jgi:hypothetical protein
MKDHEPARIVDTDSFDGDYPDEKFVGPIMIRKDCELICEIMNRAEGPRGPRFYKTVETNYTLVPGFEPLCHPSF